MRTILSLIFLLYFTAPNKVNEISNFYSSQNKLESIIEKSERCNEDVKKRIFLSKSALNIILKQENNIASRELILRIAQNLMLCSAWEDYINILKILEHRCNIDKDLFQIGKLYKCMGIYYDVQNSNDVAYKYYYKSEKILRNYKDYNILCAVLLEKAQLERKIGSYLHCEISIIKALRIAKRHNLNEKIYRCYILLGLSSSDQKDFTKADDYYIRALNLSKLKIFTFNAQAFCLNNIGANLYESGNLEDALLVYQEGLKLNNVMRSDPLIYCRLVDNYARCRFTLGKEGNVLKLLLKSARLRDSLNIREGIFENKLYISDYYLHLKDTLRANLHANEIYSQSKYHLSHAEFLLSLKQLTLTDPKNASIYKTKYIQISDSINQLERETRNKFAKIAYETEEITQLKDLAIAQRNRTILLSVSSAFFASLIIVIILQRSRNRKLLFSHIQQEANEEIYKLLEGQHQQFDEGKVAEKQRIARDLHDGVLNRLSSARFNLLKIKNKRDDETVNICLEQINEIQKIETEIRNISHDLQDEVFSSAETYKLLLDSLIFDQRNLNDCEWHVETKKINWEAVDSIIKIHIYRIIQECFQNIHKYANASNVFVNIKSEFENIIIKIHDDGVGFDLNNKRKGIGLQNITYRVDACNGNLEIITVKNSGTTINLEIPYKKT